MIIRCLQSTKADYKNSLFTCWSATATATIIKYFITACLLYTASCGFQQGLVGCSVTRGWFDTKIFVI